MTPYELLNDAELLATDRDAIRREILNTILDSRYDASWDQLSWEIYNILANRRFQPIALAIGAAREKLEREVRLD